MKKNRLSLALVTALFALSALSARSITIAENFSTDPAADGWQVFGDASLFRWNSTNQNLEVTWDSTRSNSYFYHPLGQTLTSASNFMFAMDLRLQDIAFGTTPGKPQAFQIAFGLMNFNEATNSDFIIGSGWQAPDLVEFNYFPDAGYGATISTPMISSGNNFAGTGFTFPLELIPGANYRATLIYSAAEGILRTTLSSNGVPAGPIKDSKLTPTFGSFSLDTFAVKSYSDEGQDTNEWFGVIYAGSILAHATVQNLYFSTALPVTKIVAATPGGIQFTSLTNWNYTLERSSDIHSWTSASLPVPGTDSVLNLTDTNPPAGRAFYRVRADRP